MLERIKTAALMFLVIISFFLTYKLWYGIPPYEASTFTFLEPYYFEEPRPLEETVTPSKTVFFLGNNRFLVCRYGVEGYRELWKSVFDLLNTAAPVDDTTFPQGANPALILYFNPAFPLSDKDSFKNAGMIEIYVEEKIWFLIRGEGYQKYVRTVTVEEAAGFLDQTQKILTGETMTHVRMDSAQVMKKWGLQVTSLDGYLYIPDSEPKLSSINLVNETVSPDNLIKTFFIDKNLVRTIAAKGDTFIYTDGEKGLRISVSIHYSAPRVEEGTTSLSYRAAVLKANELLCYHGGWPLSLRLEQVLSREKGFRTSYYARWVYYHSGMPIIGEGGSVWFVFNDMGISHYERALFFPVGVPGEPVVPARGEEAVAKAAAEYAAPGREGPFEINDVYLAYYLEKAAAQARAFPVWVVKINGNSIVLNAHDLTLIKVGEDNGYMQS